MVEPKQVKAAIIGATGFTGEMLVELLLSHPRVEISYISAVLEREAPFSDIFPRFKGRLDAVCRNLDPSQAAEAAEVVFLALPHRVSMEIAPLFLKKKKIVIDLSADYRFKDTRVYEKFYKTPHRDSMNLNEAVYGLPEFFRKHIKKARLIANPGCYPTVSILSIAPLLKEGLIQDVIIDAKSGITGAGRRAALEYHFAHLNGNLFGYKPFGHQHLPEINQLLSDISGKTAAVRFTPHVIPAERGILATVYGKLVKAVDDAAISDIYARYYGREPFVRFFAKKLPQLKDVIGLNFCDIGFEREGKDIVIIGVIDNLIKGAAGQAVQNMNIIMGWDERLGLT